MLTAYVAMCAVFIALEFQHVVSRGNTKKGKKYAENREYLSFYMVH